MIGYVPVSLLYQGIQMFEVSLVEIQPVFSDQLVDHGLQDQTALHHGQGHCCQLVEGMPGFVPNPHLTLLYSACWDFLHVGIL